MTDPIDLDEYRKLTSAENIYEFIGRIHSGEAKGVHEICVKCQRNNWEIVHFGKGMLMGSCNTPGCHGATFMDMR